MEKKQWLNIPKNAFEQTSLQDRINYIEQWGLPRVIQQAKDLAEQQAREHNWNIRNNYKRTICTFCGLPKYMCSHL